MEDTLADEVEIGSGELRLTSLRGRGVYPWPAFVYGDDGVVGRGSPDVADWGGKGNFGMVRDGLGVPLRDGRGEPAGIDVFVGLPPSDCLGVDVGETLIELASPEGTPSMELLDTDDTLE